MKKYVFAILIIILTAIGVSSFIHKKLNPVTFYYVIGAPNQRIESGFNVSGVEGTVTCSSYTNAANWTVTPQGADTYSGDGSAYIKSFTIDDYESDQDGDDDGQINLQEAINAVCLQYISNGLYPSTSTTVTVNATGSGSGFATVSAFTRSDHANVP